MSITQINHKQISNSPAYVEDYGAVGDDPSNDDWAAIQAAIDTNRQVIFQGKTYYISKPLESEWVSLCGAGIGSSLTPATGKTTIKKTTHTLGTSSTRDGISYAADSVLSIVHPTGSWSQGWNISGIDFQGISDADKNAYAIYAPRAAIGSMDSVNLGFAVRGFFGVSCFDLVWNQVQAYNCTTGIVHDNTGGYPAGTSWTFNNVSTNSCNTGFNIKGINYSTFNSCYAESCTNTLFNFLTCANIVLNSGGGEVPTGILLNLNTAIVTINGWQTGPLVGVNATPALSVVDSTLTLIGSTLQDFSAVNSAKNMTVTGAGSPSTVTLINSTVPTSGSAATVDGFSTYLQDTQSNHANMRGALDVQQAYVREFIVTDVPVFFTSGVFLTTPTITSRYTVINNTVIFNINFTCTVSGTGAGDIILDVPFTIDADSTRGTAYCGSVATEVFRHASTRIRANFPSITAGTLVGSLSGIMKLS